MQRFRFRVIQCVSVLSLGSGCSSDLPLPSQMSPLAGVDQLEGALYEANGFWDQE